MSPKILMEKIETKFSVLIIQKKRRIEAILTDKCVEIEYHNFNKIGWDTNCPFALANMVE